MQINLKDLAEFVTAIAALLTAIYGAIASFRTERRSKNEKKTLDQAIQASNLSKDDKQRIGDAFVRARHMAITTAFLSTTVFVAIGVLVTPVVTRTQEKTRWTKNWHVINEPRGGLGSSGPPDEGGGSFTNREAFVNMLTGLDFSTDTKLESKRVELMALVKSAEEHPKGETYYNMRLTRDIETLEDELKRGIRDRAIEHGVDVRPLYPY